MNQLKKLSILILMSIGIFACQSPGNLARNKHAQVCRDVGLPHSAQLREGDVITYRSGSYVLSDRYIGLATHAGRLAECGKMSQCLIRITEWERDCEIEQRTILFYITGYRRKCSVAKPDCQ